MVYEELGCAVAPARRPPALQPLLVTPVVVLVPPLAVVSALGPEGRDAGSGSAQAGARPLALERVLILVAEGVGVPPVQALVVTALPVDGEGFGLVPQLRELLSLREGLSCCSRRRTGGCSCCRRRCSGCCGGLNHLQEIQKRLGGAIVPTVGRVTPGIAGK